MTETLVFDFGNVIGFFDHQRAVAKLAPYTDMPATELTLQLYGSPIEDEYERGKIDTIEYVRLALLNSRLTCPPDEFVSAFQDIFWPNHAVCDLIPRLANGYRLVLASNTNAAHFARFSDQFAEVLAHFDAICTSHQAGARKPEAAFFRYCQQFAEADPSACLFIDDLPGNVEAGINHGWNGLIYRPGLDLEVAFADSGVLIPAKNS